MAAKSILFLVGFILAVGIVTVTESATCTVGGGYCTGYYGVCCNALNPGRCCPIGTNCCGAADNYGCCQIGYRCGPYYCTKSARDGEGPAQVPKTYAGAGAGDSG